MDPLVWWALGGFVAGFVRIFVVLMLLGEL
jgi:hypothetical protein